MTLLDRRADRGQLDGVLADDQAAARSANSQMPEGATALFPELLPDLDQEPPSHLEVRTDLVGGRLAYQLGFRTAVRNIGHGPLIVVGSPPDIAHPPPMRVDQLIDWPRRVIPGLGRMKYVVSHDHRHGHRGAADKPPGRGQQVSRNAGRP